MDLTPGRNRLCKRLFLRYYLQFPRDPGGSARRL
jgi:hypothetical protein